MDMLKGLGPEHMERFSNHYTKVALCFYQNFPKYPKNHRIETKLKDFGIIPLSEQERLNFQKMHNSLPSADYNVNPKGRNIAELIEIFTNFHIFDKHGKFHTDLALLFQLIENQKEYYPHQFERFQENQNGFEEKFNLMSSSFQLIQELENIQIQLKKQFKLFQGKLKSSPEENVEISKKNIKDLHILAKYFRILLSENLDKFRPINPEDPLC
ncbi:hypothetical protein PGTUg99_008335 [Puccinia graminis f. sp. tritici]|uniref:Uncharacterized protein n=1 Tax=Puccinia graminis f. sp. tritici TaxID=56615 RepID=A0A5B0RUG1_PUCGR|nr:hypothetical protein PGTUg99_008335 [Puccinia graminis f. sp. tritici]